MDEFAEAIAADLRSVSHELLERGLATRQVAQASGSAGGGSTSRALLLAVHRIAVLMPTLLDEAQTIEGLALDEVRTTLSPLRSVPSQRPSDYLMDESTGHLVPLRWLQPTHREEPVLPPLRWLMYVVETLQYLVEQHLRRLTKQVQDAEAVRSGDSTYALADAVRLRELLAPIQRAARLIALARQQIQGHAGRLISPSERLPDPFPMSSAWRSLRRDLTSLMNPHAALPELVRSLLTFPVDVAELPFLYQRWCGLQLLRAFARQGWDPAGDTVGPLFLGGKIELRNAGRQIELWVEPRLDRAKATTVGFGPLDTLDVTPDYLIVTRTRGGRDLFVLDPTLMTNLTESRKDRYLVNIQGVDALLVAGVPVARRPERAWACVPLRTGVCHLGDPAGKSGAIPMHPVHWRSEPLDAWLADVLRFDAAWS